MGERVGTESGGGEEGGEFEAWGGYSWDQEYGYLRVSSNRQSLSPLFELHAQIQMEAPKHARLYADT